MALYDHYYVVKSSITIRPFFNKASGGSPGGQAAQVTCYIDDDSTVSEGNDAIERVGAVTKMMNPSTNTSFPIKKYYNASKAFGGNTLDNGDQQGKSTANPTEQEHYCISVVGQSLDEWEFFVTIEYTAVFMELKNIAGS